MAITQAACNSFKLDKFNAVHNFGVGGDVFKLALYTSSASLDASTTAYSATNEVSGTGYTAGGATLTNIAPVLSGSTACVDFNDVTFTTATITARGALIYNSSKSNKAVAVYDFGSDKTSTAADFTITLPVQAAATAVVREA